MVGLDKYVAPALFKRQSLSAFKTFSMQDCENDLSAEGIRYSQEFAIRYLPH